jgi:hypothetical protein
MPLLLLDEICSIGWKKLRLLHHEERDKGCVQAASNEGDVA